MEEWIEVKILGKPIAAVRQSRRDKWSPKKSVVAYRAWRDYVILSARAVGLRKLDGPVEMSFIFAIAGNPSSDLDNYIKSIKDALVYGGILLDDSMKIVPRYREPVEAFSLCKFCKKRSPKRGGGFHLDCGAIKKCSKSFAWFRIREIPPYDLDKISLAYLDNTGLIVD